MQLFNSIFTVAGYCIFRTRIRRGGRKKTVSKGATYGKPTNTGVNEKKTARSLQALAEVKLLINGTST